MLEIPRMRTLKEAYSELKAKDPQTAITPNYLRHLVITGQIPCTYVGRKRLVNMNIICDYLSSPQPLADQEPQTGAIRQIKE